MKETLVSGQKIGVSAEVVVDTVCWLKRRNEGKLEGKELKSHKQLLAVKGKRAGSPCLHMFDTRQTITPSMPK